MTYSVEQIRQYLADPPCYEVGWTHYLYEVFALLLSLAILSAALYVLFFHPMMKQVAKYAGLASTACAIIYIDHRAIAKMLADPWSLSSCIFSTMSLVLTISFLILTHFIIRKQ